MWSEISRTSIEECTIGARLASYEGLQQDFPTMEGNGARLVNFEIRGVRLVNKGRHG